GTYAVLFTCSGPSVGHFARIAASVVVGYFCYDPDSGQQVWSRREGYSGDAYYLDFYRDVGFDLPTEYLGDEVGPFGTRMMTGLKYHRITGATDDKAPYQPGVALERARVHAIDFLANRTAQVTQAARRLPAPPIVVAPYDA